MIKHSVLFVFLLLNASVFGQFSAVIPSGSSIAGTSVSDTHNWTAFANPAAMSYISRAEAGFMYENRFQLNELSTKTLQAAYSTPFVTAGLQFSYMGYPLYHEMITGLGFARNFSDKFALGVQFNYLSAYFTGINEYRSVFFPQIGLNVNITPRFTIGFSTFNPFQAAIKTTAIEKRIQSVFSLGTEYFFSENFTWRVQADKELASNYRVATGFDYAMLDFLKVKLGAYYNNYLIMCIGTGFNFGGIYFDLNSELHPIMGVNLFSAIRYRF